MKRRKGVVPPHLRKFLFKKSSGGKRRKGASMAKTKRRKGPRVGAVALSMTEPLFFFGYGFGRPYITNNEYFQKAVSYIPGGPYADNILLGGGAAAIAILLRPKNAWVHQGLKTIANSESFLAGVKASAGVSMTTTQSTGSASGAPVVR